MEKLIKISQAFVVMLITFVLWWLSALSIHSTSFVFSEDGYNVFDAPIIHVAFFCLLIVICAFYTWIRNVLKERMDQNRWDYIVKLFSTCTYICLFLFLTWFVISTQLIPIEDQKMLCDGAVELKQFNFHLFQKNSYMDVYGRYHSSMLLFLEMFFAIFGDSNYLAFQMINALCMTMAIPIGVRVFYRRVDPRMAKKRGRVLATMALSLYLPWLLYASYIYGTPIGFFLAVKTLDEYDLYRENSRFHHLLLMVVCGCFALIMRRNFGIYLIALTLYAILDLVRTKNRQLLAGLLAIWFLFVGCQITAEKIVADRIGKPLTDGFPLSAYFLMSLSETEEGMPVGFNGYREVNGYDRDLKERINEFKEDPEYFFAFMAKKIAIQWNEPTFESIHVNTRHIEHNTAMPVVLSNLFRPYQYDWYFFVFNLAHSAILLGALTWFVIKGMKADWHELLFAICMLGCFLLHLVWESGSRYSVTFFYMLIPYAVEAYLELGEIVLKVMNQLKTKKGICSLSEMRMVWCWNSYAIGVVIIALLILSGSSKMLFALGDETEAYSEKLEEFSAIRKMQDPTIENGRYYMYSFSSPEFHIEAVPDGEGCFRPSITAQMLDRDSMVTVFHDYEFDFIRIGDCQLMLSLEESEDGSEIPTLDGDRCVWKIEPADNESYYIRMESYYLTENNGELGVTTKRDDETSRWRFVQW